MCSFHCLSHDFLGDVFNTVRCIKYVRSPISAAQSKEAVGQCAMAVVVYMQRPSQ